MRKYHHSVLFINFFHVFVVFQFWQVNRYVNISYEYHLTSLANRIGFGELANGNSWVCFWKQTDNNFYRHQSRLSKNFPFSFLNVSLACAIEWISIKKMWLYKHTYTSYIPTYPFIIENSKKRKPKWIYFLWNVTGVR